jgi:hypothetical protein
MTKPLGGRGKKAPYETAVIRVPIPIVSKVVKLIEDYRNLTINSEESESDKHPQLPAMSTLTTYQEALEEVKKILTANTKSKKSTAKCMAKVLQVLYGGRVTKKDLK